MKNQTVLILDFGGQYNQLIARRVREHNVYCEILPHFADIEKIRALEPVGLILTGGPDSVYLDTSPKLRGEILDLNIPVLGICYGAQCLLYALGAEIKPGADCGSGEDCSEFGRTSVKFDTRSLLFSGLPEEFNVWMSHNDYIAALPDGFADKFISTGQSAVCGTAAVECSGRKLYAVQFHPEVNHTEHGGEILHNFLYKICGCDGDWSMSNYKDECIAALRRQVGDGKVLLALSGGVDSSVCCALLAEAVPNLTCIFVDHGLLREDEGDEVEAAFAGTPINFVRVNAGERFFSKLKGVSDPEKKRRIIGEEFIRVFEDEAKKIGAVDFLAQGTIYPDVVESGLGGQSAVIKSHHNVGGLPDYVDFKEIVEPLRLLFKDEVRRLGTELGLPDTLVWRQPFPGPGLAIRIIGEVTPERARLLRRADYIFRDEIAKAGLSRDINQYFAVLTDMRSVGVMGDGRTYDCTLALRGVVTSDFMTADFARIPYDVLEKVSLRVVNECSGAGSPCGINRVVYDITGKPPSTIEWE